MTTKNNDMMERAEAEAQSEIDQILNEVEELRRELTGDGVVSPAEMSEPSVETAGAAAASDEPAVAEESAVAEELAAEASEESPESDEDLMREFHAAFEKTDDAAGDDAGLEETLGGLSPEESEGEDMGKSLLDQTFEHHENQATEKTVRMISSEMQDEDGGQGQTSAGAGSGGAGCLTMKLTGNMTLKLMYEFEGQEVTVGFVDNCLHVSLTDGTEFKIPVGGRKQALRRAG
jgi:hypothetical protein